MKHGPGWHEDPETGCWIWTGARNGDDYGVLRVGEKVRYTHVVFWEERNGPLPAGLQIDHLCKVHACCNPDHLDAVPHRENIRRGAKTKLTPLDVRAIRASSESTIEAAARYGIAPCSVSHIRGERTWADLPRAA